MQVRKTTSITLADHLSCLAFFHGDHDLRRPILLQRWRTLLPRQRAPRQRNSLSVMRQVQVLTRARRQMRSSPIPSESSVHNQPILILLKPTFLGRLGFHDVLVCKELLSDVNARNYLDILLTEFESDGQSEWGFMS